MHSSQNKQDTRRYARFAKVHIFEPSDSQERAAIALISKLKLKETSTS
jgi:indolepyruvate ferredoxin oxidoreductase alpha subunit